MGGDLEQTFATEEELGLEQASPRTKRGSIGRHASVRTNLW